MQLTSLHVVVVGGAIAGAAAALLLAGRGAKVTLLERQARATPVGAGLALADNGLAVLEGLGLAGALAGSACALSGLRVVDARGHTLLTPKPLRSGRIPRMWAVRRSALYALLARALGESAEIECEFGAEVLEVRADGTVRYQSPKGEQSVRGELVLGADGVHSRVRESGAFGAQVSRSGISYARAIGPAGLARGEEAWTSAGLFGSLQLPDGTYWYASLGTPASKQALRDRDLGRLQAIWARAYAPSAPLFGALDSFEQLLVNEVVRVRCQRFHAGRTVLLGDAAHAMAPNLGQGANSALVDAAVLVDELARAPDLEQGLARYDARRRPKVEAVASAAARLGALAEYTNPALRFMRDRVLMQLVSRRDPTELTHAFWQEDPVALSAMASARASS